MDVNNQQSRAIACQLVRRHRRVQLTMIIATGPIFGRHATRAAPVPVRAMGLSTDFYELTMMAGYHAAGLLVPATFELYVRQPPPHRSFLLAAGLEQALDYLENLHVRPEEIQYLRSLPGMQDVQPEFFEDYLAGFRFTGEAWAVEEGTPVFPLEPLLRITAPLPEGQFVETALLAHIMFQTSVASRAARLIEAASGRPVVEFGARRAHGTEAGLYAARAAYLGGCEATSNVEAGLRFGIPLSGTMAHSWVMAFGDEATAFRRYAEVFGGRAVLLLDTYDTLRAARVAAASGLTPAAVRLDSGDIVALSRAVRDILDTAGLQQTKIFASGDLDEWRIAEIVAVGAPVDAFGVGAALSTSSDAPSLGGLYKLVEIERGGAAVATMKRSPRKYSYPGRKQIWRVFENGIAVGDVLALANESGAPGGQPLLRRVMSGGRRELLPQSIHELRARRRAAVSQLPASIRTLQNSARYPVSFTQALEASIDRLSRSAGSG